MERRIGAILREARKRRGVELAEVEAATKIRLKYLRAIEDEDWIVLPGDVYARGFIRAYASLLGLDGERLAGEYRETVEGSQGGSHDPPARATGRTAGASRRSPRGVGIVAVAGVVLVAVVVIIALPVSEDGGGGGGSGGLSTAAHPRPAESAGERQEPPPRPDFEEVSVRLTAEAEVWVCILSESGERLIDGQILEAGAEEGPFHSGSFTVSFGNGEVSMLVDGKEADIPTTPSPLGYAIGADGKLTRLSESARPTCA